jgi:hypothetical protein
MVHENEIQNKLSGMLDIFEPFLTIIQTNYKLPNSKGTKGFIDILAKDSTGAFVIIELKRTDQAAREALHEVTKYAALLQREKGIPPHQIRAIIVSVEWNELIVPFSHIYRAWPHRLDGFDLILSDDGITPSSVEPVSPLEYILQPGITAVHGFLTHLDPDHVTSDWAAIVALLDSVGCADAVGIELTHEQHGTGLYIALGRVNGDDPRTASLDEWAIPEDSIEAPSGCIVEYAALCELTSKVEVGKWLTAYPEKYAALTERHNWKAGKVFRQGIFEIQADLHDDDSLKVTLAGDTGLGSIRYMGRSRPENSLHWDEFRKNVGNYLFSVPPWDSTLNAWLDEVASNTPGNDVALSLFTPSDIMTALVHSAISGQPLDQFMPNISGAVDAPPPIGRLIRGTLVWDGQVRDTEAGFISTYPTDGSWSLARAGGSVWVDDLELLKQWGISYALFEWSDTNPEGDLLIKRDGHLDREPATLKSNGEPTWEGVEPFSEFLNAHSEALGKLVERLASKTMILDDWGTQMLMD